ncbi:MAG: glycosyltransferase family 2 protein [Bacteroidetes bacterium]|nr:glycosyltransferase family 2 protein [Bacteroidota bacterium]
MPQCSLVIPLFNEAESLPELHAWIKRVCESNAITYEILFIDDGSKDHSWKVIESLKTTDSNVRGFKFARNYGKSAALHVGFQNASGEVVITLDADLQDSPEEIPALIDMIQNRGYDLVSGWKKERFDPITKTVPTKLFNWATRKMTGISLHDFNCGLKAYSLQVVKCIEVYGEMHRYIPVLAKREGFTNIGEKIVQHQARKFGTTKFGVNRFINGFLDLLSITFMSKFGKRPMHFFGAWGLVMFLAGLSLFMYLGGNKLWAMYSGEHAKNIANQSSFYIALTCMIIGTQLFLAGFIGELISRNSSSRNDYTIAQKI